MPSTDQTAPAAAWPDGVLARFLNVGGATVDISHDMLYLADTGPNLTIARCGGTGCEATHTEKWADHAYRTNNGSKGADAAASDWAQSHAEKCRAMPRPTA